MVLQVRRWLPERELILVLDGGFAAVDLARACQRHQVTMICRLRLDAAVFFIRYANKILAATTDCNPFYCAFDPREGGKIAVAEAARNLTCSGAKPLAVTDCLNFGNPYKPENFWQLREGVEGVAEARSRLVADIETHAQAIWNLTKKFAGRRGLQLGGLDFSLAPYPEDARSLGAALERLTGDEAVQRLAAAAVIAIALFAVKGFPPVGPGAEGTVGAAQRYQSQQIEGKDVVLQDAAVQQLLQSDSFRRLISDKEARAKGLGGEVLCYVW